MLKPSGFALLPPSEEAAKRAVAAIFASRKDWKGQQASHFVDWLELKLMWISYGYFNSEAEIHKLSWGRIKKKIGPIHNQAKTLLESLKPLDSDGKEALRSQRNFLSDHPFGQYNIRILLRELEDLVCRSGGIVDQDEKDLPFQPRRISRGGEKEQKHVEKAVSDLVDIWINLHPENTNFNDELVKKAGLPPGKLDTDNAEFVHLGPQFVFTALHAIDDTVTIGSVRTSLRKLSRKRTDAV